jgi:hypothetical protein
LRNLVLSPLASRFHRLTPVGNDKGRGGFKPSKWVHDRLWPEVKLWFVLSVKIRHGMTLPIQFQEMIRV